MRFDWRIWKMENGTIAIEILQIVSNDVWILFFYYLMEIIQRIRKFKLILYDMIKSILNWYLSHKTLLSFLIIYINDILISVPCYFVNQYTCVLFAKKNWITRQKGYLGTSNISDSKLLQEKNKNCVTTK